MEKYILKFIISVLTRTVAPINISEKLEFTKLKSYNTKSTVYQKLERLRVLNFYRSYCCFLSRCYCEFFSRIISNKRNSDYIFDVTNFK